MVKKIMGKIVPTYHAKSIYEVDPHFYAKINVKVLLLDLDNTLDSYRTKLPSQKTIDYINKLKELNIRPIITSNNRGKRVARYATALNIEYLSLVNKPFKRRLLKKLKKLNIDPNDCLIIGDQLLTDVRCGCRAKIRTMYTDKLVKEDSFFTHFNRVFEKPLRARLKKYGKLNYWKTSL